MVECSFCGEEFEDEKELHRHWDEHKDELNSHQKEKVKKAKRQKEEQKKAKMQKRKQYAGYGLAAVILIGLIGVVGAQLLNSGGDAGGALDNLDGQPTMGSEDATVTVVEFGDYKCPFCRQFETEVFPQLKSNYIDNGQVKFKFVNYAFLGASSDRAAVAGECVYNQDPEQFWDFHKSVYENQGPESQDWATQDFLMELARENTENLNYNSLETCISSQQTVDEVRKDQRIGSQAGVTGTPAVYVNGQKVQNALSYSSISSVIDQELN